MKIRVSPDLALPLDAATETFAILGRRGSGKTHTAIVMAEEMLRAGVQVVVLDPLDVWWGLRVSQDGKAPGLAIYVAGGSHADVPLTGDAGRVLADAVVDRGLSIVLSLRHLSKADQRRFVGDFCERLYDRKADPTHRTALHVFIDEADAFVPQRLVPGSERCFGAVDTLVRRGRSSGLAPTLISQRPQVINKDVLSQTEVLVSHQLTGPQDRKALEAWIDANDTENQRGAFMASLASLPKGTAWFWSPGLLGIFKRIAVRDRTTFDSSATPKAGVRAVASPKAFAAVDLEALTAEIAATIERAKADDPRELRRRIATLERELAAKPVAAPPERVEVPVHLVTTEQVAELKAAVASLEDVGRVFDRAFDQAADLCNCVNVTAHAIGVSISTALAKPRIDPPRTPAPAPRAPASDAPPRQQASASPGNASLGKAERAILTVLAQHGPSHAGRLTLLSGYRYSGGFRNSLSTLRTSGFITGGNDQQMAITPAGERAVGPVPPPLAGDALRSYWLNHPSLGKCERAILGALFHRPGGAEAAWLCSHTGYEYSGGFRNALSALRTAGLIEGGNGDVMRASAVLLDA